jgi:hypothetical protein
MAVRLRIEDRPDSHASTTINRRAVLWIFVLVVAASIALFADVALLVDWSSFSTSTESYFSQHNASSLAAVPSKDAQSQNHVTVTLGHNQSSLSSRAVPPGIREEETNIMIKELQNTSSSAMILDDPQTCLFVRGSSGKWIQDWDYASRSYYKNYGSYNRWHRADQNFTSTPEQPYRLATSYRWQDDHCPVKEVNVVEFCRACQQLNINQILVLGDSLSTQFMQSAQSLLGFPPKGKRAKQFEAHFRPWTMKCPNTNGGDQQKITFLCQRMSLLKDWGKLSKKKETSKATKFVNKNDNRRTAIVANLGSWMETTEDYRQGFTFWLDWLGSFDEDTVVPFFRPTIPGHLDCLPTGNGEKDYIAYDWKHTVQQEPYKNYAEYKTINDALREMTNKTNRWELFEEWNSWSFQTLYGSNDDNNLTAIPTSPRTITNTTARLEIHWLNIFPSGVLRRDGHVGFGDCHHYSLPGPIDSWSHFFHSALLDLAGLSSR